MADMSMDVRVRRLIRAYGIEGYGLYVYILEHIVRKLETETPVPDLEESSADIASDTGMDAVRVEQIIWFCIEQGLFDQDEVTGRILASMIYKFLQASETRSDRIRAMIKAYKGGKPPLLLSETVTDVSEEQNRTEQNRT
jgi:hypothetical protein